MQSRLELREDQLILMHDAQLIVAAELEQLSSPIANRTSEFVEVHSAAKDGKRPAKRAKVNRGSENSSGAPSIAAYFALLAECNELNSRLEALMLENMYFGASKKGEGTTCEGCRYRET